MGIFSKIFGSGTPSVSPPRSTEDRISTAEFIMRTEVKATVARCGVPGCGISFPSLGSPEIHGYSLDRFELDSGGYCIKCRMYVCPRHAELIETRSALEDRMTEVPEFLKKPICVVCRTCGQVLWSSEAQFKEELEKQNKKPLERLLKSTR
jgi:hypothetical protein